VAEPLVSRIDVVYLYVRDLDRSIAFYRDVLGIPVEGDDWGAACEFADPDGYRLHLFERPG
jgi:catechol 2,3-dioxygenase-like lactoylglutathione lyase family enzyme